jgi:dihydrofolate reductase
MGKVILTMHMSLDGIVTNQDQWLTFSDEMLEEYLGYYNEVDHIILGGNTYTSLAEYWQHAEQSSHSEVERAIARRINEIPKIVLSRSPKELIWKNSKQITMRDAESFAREMQVLKSSTGTISVESGLKTWQLFIQHELFDHLWIFVHPVIASTGEKLFENTDNKQTLQLLSSRTYKNGVLGLNYRKV